MSAYRLFENIQQLRQKKRYLTLDVLFSILENPQNNLNHFIEEFLFLLRLDR